MIRLAVALAGFALTGCATSSLVLLPDESGEQGAVAILETDGKPTESVVQESNTRTRLGQANAPSRPLGSKGLKAKEAALVAGLPPPPRSFTLYFEQGTTNLTPQSEAVLGEVRQELTRRTGAEIEITGHTDTVGSEDDNDALSRSRAQEVLNWLVSKGFDRSAMSAVGRGERELVDQTGDNVASTANRRVEVIVR